VRPGNASAHALYRRLGFALTGRRPGYYRDGGEALVLSLVLAPAEERSYLSNPLSKKLGDDITPTAFQIWSQMGRIAGSTGSS
jgi:hypothetical protein